MKHVFKATKLGWEKEKEGIWFDSDDYTAQEAKDEFKPYEGTTQRGYSYTGYEYDGQKYHDAKNERISGNEGNPNNERGTPGCSNHSYHSPAC